MRRFFLKFFGALFFLAWVFCLAVNANFSPFGPLYLGIGSGTGKSAIARTFWNPTPTPLYRIYGTVENQGFGQVTSNLDDIDGDGRPDFIVGVPRQTDSGGPYYAAGRVIVYSGANGNLLFRIDGDSVAQQFGWSVTSMGDLDTDGKGDFAIVSEGKCCDPPVDSATIFIYSGASESLLFKVSNLPSNPNLTYPGIGLAIRGLGDINGDGKREIVLGNPFTNYDSGAVSVFNGSDGSLLYQINASSPEDSLGWSVAEIGDINGDEKPDFIVGAPFASHDTVLQSGSAFVYSGLDGALIFREDGTTPGEYFGWSVSGCGDVDSDETPDFIIGNPVGVPAVSVYSGRTGDLLYELNGFEGSDQFGFSLSEAGDVNLDGKADFIVGAPGASPNGLQGAGSTYIYSGPDGALIAQIDGLSSIDQLGWSVCKLGDVQGNGSTAFLVGAPYSSAGGRPYSGYATVYSLCGHRKGDLNGDDNLTPADVVLMLNCVFMEAGSCGTCFTDVSCNGILTSSDVVIELNAVFLEEPIGCLQ